MIGRVIAIALILAAMAGVQRVGPPVATSLVTLPLGFALIAAYLLGGVAAAVKLPRLSGYLVFGLVCGPYLLNLITAPMARDLQVVNGFALALIALVAGLELNLTALRAQWRGVLMIGGAVMLGALAVLTLLLWLLWPMLPLGETGAGLERLAAALLTAALVISFSPTVTIAVIAEARARGPFTELVMAIVILTDLLLILVFALALQFGRWAATGAAGAGIGVGVQLSWEILGSLAFGGLVGAGFAVYLRLVGREVTLALLAVCALLAVVAPLAHFELILAALAAGLVVENIAPPEGEALKTAIERGALPVLVAFFAAAGASLRLDVLALVGPVALGLAAVRLGLVRGLSYVATRSAGLHATPARHAWMGLVSQAGVTLGLAALVAAEFPSWGAVVQTLIVALTGVHVLVGPIFLRAALQRAGEIGRT
ncbi:MAG: cation:proton antiporter [Vicinamibacterales bacterium]